MIIKLFAINIDDYSLLNHMDVILKRMFRDSNAND